MATEGLKSGKEDEKEVDGSKTPAPQQATTQPSLSADVPAETGGLPPPVKEDNNVTDSESPSDVKTAKGGEDEKSPGTKSFVEEHSKSMDHYKNVDHSPPEERPVAMSSDKRFIKYDVEIGRGSFKTVYKGVDTETGIPVAWCELQENKYNKGEQARFKEEIAILKTLQHPNVLKLYDSWEMRDKKDRKVFILITELMTSGTLKSYMKRLKELRPKVMRSWGRQILKGLYFLHTRTPPIIHRDLKCDNIFINGTTGMVKIGDLGLATLKRSEVKTVIGTPEFMAPEMYEESYDEKVDVYAFGMCLLEMATGEYPYMECTNPAQIYRKVVGGVRPNALDKVKDPLLREIIENCINPDKNKRYSVKDLLNHEFFADTVRVEVVDDEENTVQLKMKLEMPGNKEVLKNSQQAIEFDYNIENDDPEAVVEEMIRSGIVRAEDKTGVLRALKEQVEALKSKLQHRKKDENGPMPSDDGDHDMEQKYLAPSSSQDGDSDSTRQDIPSCEPREDTVTSSNVIAEEISRRPEGIQSPVHRSSSASTLTDQDLLDKGAQSSTVEQNGLPGNYVIKAAKSDTQLNHSPPSQDAVAETKLSDEEQQHSEALVGPSHEGHSEEETTYSVQEAQEASHDSQPVGVKGQDSSQDVQPTSSTKKKKSSKSKENVTRRGGIRLTQVGIEEENVAQCSLVTSTGKVVTFKFSLDYDKPSELCRHLIKHGFLQSNEEEEFLQQVADVLQKTKLEKKKPGPKPLQEPAAKAVSVEPDVSEAKGLGTTKPSDSVAHQEAKAKAAEGKTGDVSNPPPPPEQKILKDESTTTSPPASLDHPVSQIPKERFISQASIDSTLSSGASTPQLSVAPSFPTVVTEDAHIMLEKSIHAGFQGFQPTHQAPLVAHPATTMPSVYTSSQQPLMHTSLPPSALQSSGGLGTAASSSATGAGLPTVIGLCNVPNSNVALGTIPPPSKPSLGTLPTTAPGLNTIPSNPGLGTLPTSAGVGNLTANATLGPLPPNAGVATLAPNTANIPIGTLSQSVPGLGSLPPPAASIGTLQMNPLQPPAGGLGTVPPVALYASYPPLGPTPYGNMANPLAPMSSSMGLPHQSTLPQNIPSALAQGMPLVHPQTIPTSQGMPSSLPTSTIPSMGVPLQSSLPTGQLPHIVSYSNLSMATAQPEQAKKFEISEVAEGSPLAVHFADTVFVDNSAEGEEEDTLESSDSAMYDPIQTPATPAVFSSARSSSSAHLNGIVPGSGDTAYSMTMSAKMGRPKRSRLRALHRPSSGHANSTYTAPTLSPVVDCSPMVDTQAQVPRSQASFLPAESQALFNETFGQFLFSMHNLLTSSAMQPLVQQLCEHFGKRADTSSEAVSRTTSEESTSYHLPTQPVAESDEHVEEGDDDQDDSDEEEGDYSEKDGDEEYAKLVKKFDQEKQQLLERRRQALEEYKKKKDAKRHLGANTLHLSLRQGVGTNSSPDRVFHASPGGGRDTPPQSTPSRPAKKSSLEKKNTAKTYAEVSASTVEKESVEKKTRPEPANPERDNMQKKVVAELTTSLVNPKAQLKKTATPGVGTALSMGAAPAGVANGKERVFRSGSIGANLASAALGVGGAQVTQGTNSRFQRHTVADSEWTEFTGVTPKGSQVVGSTTVTNGSGPVGGSSAGGGGGGGGGGAGGGYGTTSNSTRVDITEFDPISKS